MTRASILAMISFVVSIFGTPRLRAQQAGRSGTPLPGTYGTQDRILYPISAMELAPTSSSVGFDTDPYPAPRRFSTTPAGVFYAGPRLPAGALVTYFELDACDTNATTDVSAVLLSCSFLGDSCTPIGAAVSTAGTPGCAPVAIDLTPSNYTVNNFLNRLLVSVTTPSGDNTNSFAGVYIGYKLQVSPPPGTASFLDVPTTSPLFPFVEALKASGITAGCDATHFCPSDPLSRGQMAVFLATALGLNWPN